MSAFGCEISSGDLDDNKIVDGASGERRIYEGAVSQRKSLVLTNASRSD